jgi:3-hydroxyisobutyrate dehydrogenase-like beta-hydroxyacid dehydrogenase
MSKEVTVIGLGHMGSALARRFLAGGHPTTVWNRTAAKAEPLRAGGATVAADAPSAIASTAISIVCLERHDHVVEILQAADREKKLAGRTIVNLTLGTASDARSLAAWLTESGARLLDGMIHDYPEDVGAPSSLVSYAGERSVYDANQELLSAIAPARYLRPDVAGANVIGSAGAAFHNLALGAFYEAVAYADHFGVTPAKLLDAIESHGLELLRSRFRYGVASIERGDYETDQAAIRTHYDAACIARDDMRQIGQPADLTAAFCQMLQAAIDAGDGNLEIAALYGRLRNSG